VPAFGGPIEALVRPDGTVSKSGWPSKAQKAEAFYGFGERFKPSISAATS
jgi:hypothetical protein